MKIENKKQFNKILVTAGGAVLLLFTVGFTYAYFADNTPEDAAENDPGQTTATDAEPSGSQSAKERIFEEGNNSNDKPNKPSDGDTEKESVTVGISYADVFEGQLDVRAFTPDVVEGNGTCTATVSKQGYESVIKTVEAFIDASSTICNPIYIPVSDLAPGTWTVNVSFSSPTHEGSSGPVEVEV